VGDFDVAQTTALLGELLGDWKSSVPYVRVPRPHYDVTPKVITLETPDKANAFFTAGLRFPLEDSDPDYAALVVANRIFGGGPGSRLWQRVREKEGLSYGIGSNFVSSQYEPRTVLTIGAIYAPQNLARLEKAFGEEMQRALSEGFTAEQLKDAKTGLLQARKLARAQDGSLADTLVDRITINRTLAFDEKIDSEIEAMTLDRVNAVFRKYIDPSKLTTVRAGDFAKAAAAK
jgi:zinc protease